MRRKLFHLAFSTAVLVLLASATALAQDFQKNYEIGAGGRISVSSVSGNIRITGYDANVIAVRGIKEGRDRDMVEVVDQSSGNSVDLRVRYPQSCNCDASVRFEVEVPRSMNFDFSQISTASGDIEIRGVTGQVHARTASGDIQIGDVTGSVNASAASGDLKIKNTNGAVSARNASGDIDVEISQLTTGSEGMTFSSASGNVTVKLPSNVDAEVEMSSLSGTLSTDFPLQIEEGSRPTARHHATGRLGSGSRTIKLSSTSGNVSLKSI